MDEPARILVADDVEGQRLLLDMLLSVDGNTVDMVEDGRAALDYLRNNTPDLVILDVAMPYMSGIDICGRMKRIQRLKHIPVVILTALDDERTRGMARFAKADAIITKPLEGKDFRAAIRDLLAGARSARP